jgi:hypothetical protein
MKGSEIFFLSDTIPNVANLRSFFLHLFLWVRFRPFFPEYIPGPGFG